MAFTQKILKQTFMGHKRVVYGSWTTDTDNGTIETTLRQVEHIDLQYTGSAAVAESPSVNETMPCGGNVKIVCTANKNGLFFAFGW